MEGWMLTGGTANQYLAKWFGFFFGVGRNWAWATARQGGPEAQLSRTLSVGIRLADIPNATQFPITLTKPDGSTVSSTCSASPCAISGDARLGTHLATIEYLSAGGEVLASGSGMTVTVESLVGAVALRSP